MADEKLTPQEEVVKRYLEEQMQKDEVLRTLYVPSKIKDCFKHITSQARKLAKNGCAMVEDAVVFKWARDYYLEVLPKEAEKPEVKATPKLSPDVQQMLDKADKVIAEQKEVTVVKDGQKYDKNGNGLLFDF